MNDAAFTFGKFVWWIGKVEDIYDPEKLGRLRVRVYGYYSDEIPKEDLPWAGVVGSIRSASLGGVGESPTGILEGTTVFGFFIDGESAQVPIVAGTLYGKGVKGHDVHGLAKGNGGGKPGYSSTSKQGGGVSIPGTAYNAKYPHNQTITGENGVIFELDNTKKYERLAWEHPSGTWFEAQPNGNQINRVSKDNYTAVLGDDYILVNGNVKIFVGGNADITVDGNVETKVGGNMTTKVNGSYTLEVGGKYLVTGSAGGTHTFKLDYDVKASNIWLN